jgi:Zn-dependent protease with chaperone function
MIKVISGKENQPVIEREPSPVQRQHRQKQNSQTVLQQLSNAVSQFVHLIFAPFIYLHNWIRPINPVTGEREFRIVPTCVEKFIGQLSYQPLVAKSGGEIFEDDSEYGHYAKLVREVGEELVENCPRKDLEFEFKLINSHVDNAWCLPGGKIGVNLGMIKNMAKEHSDFGLDGMPTLREKLGAVLSHEITHAAARHGGRTLEFRLFLFAALQAVKYALAYLIIHRSYDKEMEEANGNPVQMAKVEQQRAEAVNNSLVLMGPLGNWLITGVTLCSGRSHELEADKFGMHLMAKTKDMDPKAAVWLMHYFKKHHNAHTGIGWYDWIQGLFLTHPTPTERLKANLETWEQIK